MKTTMYSMFKPSADDWIDEPNEGESLMVEIKIVGKNFPDEVIVDHSTGSMTKWFPSKNGEIYDIFMCLASLERVSKQTLINHGFMEIRST